MFAEFKHTLRRKRGAIIGWGVGLALYGILMVSLVDLYYFGYMLVIVGIFAAVAGAGLLVSDEENDILDLVLAHPVSRTALFWGWVLHNRPQ
jgi:putative exporter of polyketide antibiotics